MLVAASTPAVPVALAAAVAAPTRTPANIARDRSRHPAETLAFFGVKPTDTGVEVWPAGGWYTEILAPLTAKRGAYYAAG
ncbi:MAG TPA: methyltransferase, partial [Sphingomonas sp.]|nr:methyltransferase [Sphingomonas sp.]